MEAPSSLPRDPDGIPRGKYKVPRRIGRPPVWTSTRSRKLARLYMYTTLSVDNILEVLEDDMFKPKKNSAQKTIHNMLGCDPRYLRPESREDMNQRIKLLSASSRRNRGMGKNSSDPSPEAAFPSPPLPPPTYCDVRLHNEMSQSDISMSQNPCHPLDLPLQSQSPHQQHSAHDAPLYLPPLPPLPTPRLHNHGLFVHSRTHKPPEQQETSPFVVAGRPRFSPSPQHQTKTNNRIDSAAHMSTIRGAPFNTAQHHCPRDSVAHHSQQNPHQQNPHPHPHPRNHADHPYADHLHHVDDGLTPTEDGNLASSHLPLDLTDPHQQRPPRPNSAYSTTSAASASSDISLQTVENLKRRLPDCSTHYASQVANLLRRLTISSGSDGPPPGLPLPYASANDNDQYRIQKRRQRRQQDTMGGWSGGGSHIGYNGRIRSDSDVFSESDSDDSDYGYEDGSGGQENDKVQSSGGEVGAPPKWPVIVGACGDNAGNPQLVTPGDFFNAHLYRGEFCAHKQEQQQQKKHAQHHEYQRRLGQDPLPLNPVDPTSNVCCESRCWCAIADAVSIAGLDGDRMSIAAQAIMDEHAPYNMSHHDCFGHTPLHLCAAREGAQMQLLAVVSHCNNTTLALTNTAGQTFLHLLAPGWFMDLTEPEAPLHQLLAHLLNRETTTTYSSGHAGHNTGSGSLVYVTDIYGRSFFHRLHAFVDNPALLASILQDFHHGSLARRDAFGHSPLPLPLPGADGGSSRNDSPLLDPWQQQRQQPAPSLASQPSRHNKLFRYDDGSDMRTTMATASTAVGTASAESRIEVFVRHHESLSCIVTATKSHPMAEDSEGRNGLHRLAEAIVDERMMDVHRALGMGRKLPKKKAMGNKDTLGLLGGDGGGVGRYNNGSIVVDIDGGDSAMEALGGLLGCGISGSGSPGASGNSRSRSSGGSGGNGSTAANSPQHTSPVRPQIATRLQLVRGLLSPPLWVDVNHYDHRGQTVLMAFVTYIPDDQEDKAKSLAALFGLLLAAGACLEARNRRGETALLVAARLGRTVALTSLLCHGANVHVRDMKGRGVLDVIDIQCRHAAHKDVALYGRLEACRVLLTGKKYLFLGAKQRPTLLDEWSAVPAGGWRGL